MHHTEHHRLQGICLRLIQALDVKRPEAFIIARWISERPEVFGKVLPVIVMGRRGPILDAQGWDHLASHLAAGLEVMPEPSDLPLHRMRTITAHLGLSIEEEAILCFLALQQRQGAVAEFGAMLTRDIGLSDEAVISWCCNLDDDATWAALAPRGRLVTLGLVQTDGTQAVLRDLPYRLSGLLSALIQPPTPNRHLTLVGQGGINHSNQ